MSPPPAHVTKAARGRFNDSATKAVVLELLRWGVGVNDIARETGMPATSVRRYRDKCVTNGALVVSDQGKTAAPPAPTDAPAESQRGAVVVGKVGVTAPALTNGPDRGAALRAALPGRTMRAAAKILGNLIAHSDLEPTGCRDLQSLATAYGILVDKARLLSGETTQNIGVLAGVQIRAVASAVAEITGGTLDEPSTRLHRTASVRPKPPQDPHE